MRLIDQHGSGDYSYSSYRPFTDLVTEQAVKCEQYCVETPKRVDELQMETRSNQLANSILSQGATSKSPIGVMMDRGVDMIVSMIAVLKSGAPFLPLDPDTPAERLSYMLEDSGAELLLTH